MSGRRNKQRGYELEAEVVAEARAAGIDAKRVFASGAHKQELGEDFACDVRLGRWKVECKRRKNGFGVIYDAFDQDDADIVCVRADRRERLYVVKGELLMQLLRAAS